MILFTADWHIKLGQKNVPKDWALNRYGLFFEQIHSLETQCEMHIIGGDLFDRLPSMEELELYFSFIREVGIPTIIYDGNHEATKKHKTFFTQLKQVTRLFTHVRGEIPPHVKPEVDLDRFEDFPIVFAGDLHAHSNSQRNIVYPGSPMTTSFHRSEVKTGYILINPEDWSWMWDAFELPQLIRKTVADPSEMLPTDYHHTIYELEGDMQDLANVKNSDLLDKKVVKRNTEATLIMDKEMSIQEELVEYLTYILEISENKISDIVGVFNDYAAKIEVE